MNDNTLKRGINSFGLGGGLGGGVQLSEVISTVGAKIGRHAQFAQSDDWRKLEGPGMTFT
jgi:hypothetical protein